MKDCIKQFITEAVINEDLHRTILSMKNQGEISEEDMAKLDHIIIEVYTLLLEG